MLIQFNFDVTFGNNYSLAFMTVKMFINIQDRKIKL